LARPSFVRASSSPKLKFTKTVLIEAFKHV
jgi:hypothetical protein